MSMSWGGGVVGIIELVLGEGVEVLNEHVLGGGGGGGGGIVESVREGGGGGGIEVLNVHVLGGGMIDLVLGGVEVLNEHILLILSWGGCVCVK